MSGLMDAPLTVRPRILVVDDEQRIRDACQMVLSAMDVEVDLAPDGQQCLEMIDRHHFDLILVDLMMPVLSGFDVLRQVREHHPDTVVIVITGYATVEHSVEAMKQGAFDFIPKPFSPDQLRTVVTKSILYTQALQDISQSRSRLRVLVNRLTDGVMTTDVHKQVVLANPAFLHLIGYHGEEVTGRPLEAVLGPGPLLDSIEQVLQLPEEEVSEISTELTVRIGTEERIISARCSPFRGRDDRTLGTITVLHDITAIRAMDRMKSDFVAMVAHEIRNPMNSLLMQLKNVLDGLAGELTEQQQVILSRASGKIKSLDALVGELLDLARIESGLVTAERSAVQVVEMVEESVAFHQASARAAGIELLLLSGGELAPVMVNGPALEEVLTNLIGNAIKYSPSGSRITVACREEKGYLAIEVRDTGYGMAPEELEHIFTRFYRVKDAQTRHIHGTGLGLAIVQAIVHAHQGTVQVESAPGKGSCFTVLLPLP